MKPKMTPAQLRGSTALVGDIAIRAGAGSGKTTVLAHRFANALMQNHPSGQPLDWSRVLTITFTNKAAGEVAERVRRVVSDELGGARYSGTDTWISTIHSFCGRIVRRHVLESGVEPYFSTADEMTTQWLRIEAFESAAESLYAADLDVADLIDALGVEELQQRVLATHDNVRSLGLDPVAAVVPLDLDELGELRHRVCLAAACLADALQVEKQTEAVVSKTERLAEWSAQVTGHALTHESACDELSRVLAGYDIGRFKGEAKEANELLKQELQSLSAALQAVRHRRHLQAFERLLHEFARRYREVKRQRGLLDFDDLQEVAVRLLEGKSGVARRFREQFEHVMVDEFQDTNELQVRVLAPLLRDNLCVVGDERQSIYGFRYADVEIFGRVQDSADELIELKTNFRSHCEIVDFVNAAFVQPHLFGPDFMQLDAGRDGGWTVPLAESAARVECLLVDEGAGDRAAAREAEAEWIANKVSELIVAGTSGRDIAVLLRSAGNAALYAAELNRKGVPVVVAAGADLFSLPETEEVMELLRAIAIPGDDRALLKTLSGRMVSLTDDGLLAVGTAAAGGALWDGLSMLASGEAALRMSAEDRTAIEQAHVRIKRLGRLLGTLRLSEFVLQALESFDYDLTLYASGPEGARAWSNVLKLVRYAEGFERAESNDPVEFVEYLKRRGESGTDKSSPAGAGDGAVHVMTVHAAKGLEFPVVFVADLAARQVHDPAAVLVESGREEGAAPVPRIGVRLPKDQFEGAATPLYQELQRERRARETEEEKRCLYVACTRAQELLVLSGCCKLDRPADEGGGLIDWIRESIGRDDAGIHPLGKSRVRVEVLEAPPREEGETPETPAVACDGPLAVEEPEIPAVRQPATPPKSVSFSALHRHQRCSLSFYATHSLGLRRFAPPDETSAADFGSAVHALLQQSAHGAVEEARVMAVARGFRLSDEAVDQMRAAASAFLTSELGRRARSADRVATEVPFAIPVGGVILRGSMDLVSWRSSGALIVDYKTGRAPRQGSDADEDGRRLQAECYALAMLESGIEDVEVTFAFVQHPGNEVPYRFGRADTAALRSRIESLVKAAAEGEPRPLQVFDATICSDCPALGTICPVRAPRRSGC